MVMERSGVVAAGTRLTQTFLIVPQITALRFAGSLLLSAAYQTPHRSLKAFAHLGFLFVSEKKIG